MALLRLSSTGIVDQSHQVAAVAAIPNYGLNTLVGHDAHRHDVFDAEIAQHIVEIGGVEEARRGFGYDDLVLQRCQIVDDLGPPASG